MTREEFRNLLLEGFSAKALSELIKGGLSEGRINILKHSGVEGKVYHYDDINADAILDAFDKNEIKYDDIDVAVASAQIKKQARSRLSEGIETSKGIIEKVLVVKDTTFYLIDGKLYRRKDLEL